MKYVVVALVIAWIAFGVVRGALTGLAEARQEELSAMPLPEMLEVVAGSEERRIGSEWVDNALVLDIEASRRTIVYSLKMTRKTKDEIDASWSRGWRSTIRRQLTRKACNSRLLGLALSRGARVAYDCTDQDGRPAFRFEVARSNC